MKLIFFLNIRAGKQNRLNIEIMRFGGRSKLYLLHVLHKTIKFCSGEILEYKIFAGKINLGLIGLLSFLPDTFMLSFL